MSYQTTQKLAILKWVKQARSHPTAEEVYRAVKKNLPNISFATVYRNLAALAKNNQLKEIQFIDKKKRYESNTHDHQHFLCQKCQRIIDMELSELLNIEETVAKMQCHSVTSYDLELAGICASCQK